MIKFAFLLLLFNMKGKVEHNIDSLRKQGVDTFMVFAIGPTGSVEPPCPDHCCDEEPEYLCYVQNGQYFLKKMTLCGDHKPTVLPKENPLSYYTAHKEKIDMEQIREPVCRYPYLPATSSHTSSYYITGIIGNTRVVKQINVTELNYKGDPHGCRNINYKYNQSTKTKVLVDIWDKIFTNNGTTRFYDAFSYEF